VLFAIVLMGFGVATPTTTVETVPACVLTAQEAQARYDATGSADCRAGDPASPAATAGLLPGDELVSLGGTPVTDWEQVASLIRDHGAGTMPIVVERAGARVSLTADLVETQRAKSAEEPDTYVTVGYLGVSPTIVNERQSIAAVPGQMWDFTSRTFVAIISIPQRMVDVWHAAFDGEDRGLDSPIGIVGAGRIGGEFAALPDVPISEKAAGLLGLLAGLNMALGIFNLLPLLPLDGGHIAGALYEAARRGIARLRRRPDPGHFDVAKLLPVAYVVAIAVIGMSALLIYADIVNPVRLTG
jgi:membrane-associated protease RseP (regulator of RpoE activity)